MEIDYYSEWLEGNWDDIMSFPDYLKLRKGEK